MNENSGQNNPEIVRKPSGISAFLDASIDAPVGSESFAEMTPSEILKGTFPEGFDLVAGLVSGLGIDYGISIPDWAQASSQQFFKYYFGAEFKPLETFENIGTVAGLFEFRLKTPIPPRLSKFAGILKFVPELLRLLEAKVREASPREAADFYAGRANAELIFEKMQDREYLKMVKVAPIYLSVAAGWKCFQMIHSYAEAEDFLRFQQVIGREVDSRECRAVFKRIKFPAGKPGRPRK